MFYRDGVLDTVGLVDQATALTRYPAGDAALCAGDISVRQAAAIIDSLDALPTTPSWPVSRPSPQTRGNGRPSRATA